MEKSEILRLCDFMQLAEADNIDWMLAGSNHVFVVTMVHDGREVKSIYKPRNGEAPLWDFPDGTLYKREYAAFLISMEIGWYFIPPTIVRQGPYGIGSMQYMVEIPKRTRNFGDITIATLELKKIVVFDYLVNNADRKVSHLLKDKSDRIWIVDHGLTFNAVPKLRTVFWDFAGQKIPRQLIADVQILRDKLKQGGDLRDKLLRLLDKEEIEALDIRISQVIKDPEYPYPDSPWSVPYPWY
ncbi:MAG: hypothetical protein JSU79_02835 [Dehalococcoidales bacterium]|nr:MAG: hypothetical protein JSU79_02835 [Dehalococcoidales bacterium]